MLGSKSQYFNQSEEQLKRCRIDLVLYLKSQRFSVIKRSVYLRAFDYFCENPKGFDGATVVKDLHHIPGLDINAMLHDYHCVVYNIASSFRAKWRGDWLYAKQMEHTGKGWLSWFNFGLLKLVGIPHIVYANYKRGYINAQQLKAFENDYKNLMK